MAFVYFSNHNIFIFSTKKIYFKSKVKGSFLLIRKQRKYFIDGKRKIYFNLKSTFDND